MFAPSDLDLGGYCCFSCFAGWGVFFALGGIAGLAFRIVVDANGIVRSSWFGLVTYRDSWGSLKSWTLGRVEDKEILDRFFIEFDFQGRNWPIRLEASLVGVPGFEKFVADVRFYAGSKETVNAVVQTEMENWKVL